MALPVYYELEDLKGNKDYHILYGSYYILSVTTSILSDYSLPSSKRIYIFSIFSTVLLNSTLSAYIM